MFGARSVSIRSTKGFLLKIKNVRPFGNFVPGDVVEVPDGASFDVFHFVKVDEPDQATPSSSPEGGVK